MSDEYTAKAKVDLIYAILALDSYNRGYGAGVSNLLEVGATARIGNYSIVQNISQSGWKDAGFYAIAYRNTATGEVVISYRGTDAPALGSDASGGSDPANAYGLALGNTQDNTYFLSPLSLLLGSKQSGLAAQFYEAVQRLLGCDSGTASSHADPGKRALNDNAVIERMAA